jgi:signal peptidase I
VFKHPRDESREFIKRIVALPGEQVQIRSRHVYVNGNPLAEPYVKSESIVKAEDGHCGHVYGCEPTAVPSDSYFVLGDNRENSQDSRYWGFLKREKVVGRVFAIYWSWDRP